MQNQIKKGVPLNGHTSPINYSICGSLLFLLFFQLITLFVELHHFLFVALHELDGIHSLSVFHFPVSLIYGPSGVVLTLDLILNALGKIAGSDHFLIRIFALLLILSLILIATAFCRRS